MSLSHDLENTIQEILKKFDFNVRLHYSLEKTFDVDILATRSGLALLIECIQKDILAFDSVARLNTLGSFVQKKFEPVTVRKVVVTTAIDIPDHVEKFAQENDILVMKVKPDVEEVRDKFSQIAFLKPLKRLRIDITKEVESKLREKRAEECIDLLHKVMKWYEEGGKRLVKQKIVKEVNQIRKRATEGTMQ